MRSRRSHGYMDEVSTFSSISLNLCDFVKVSTNSHYYYCCYVYFQKQDDMKLSPLGFGQKTCRNYWHVSCANETVACMTLKKYVHKLRIRKLGKHKLQKRLLHKHIHG